MEKFYYKELSIMTNTYTRDLQNHALALEEEIYHLQEELAKSGSHYYMKEAAMIGQHWTEVNLQLGELQGQIRRLELENEYLQEKLQEYQQAEKPDKQRQSRPRDVKTGQFVSVPASQKPFQAYLMDKQGYSVSQIAVKLGVSNDSVKRYIRKEKADRMTDNSPDSDCISVGYY